MITDARVLQADFTPRDVRHRDSEVDALTTVLDPLVQGDYADPAILYGPSGAGKTCIANYTVEQLRQAVLDVDYQYVNCWQNYSGYRTLYRILEGLGKTVDVHRRSTPLDELLERLQNYDGPPVVVILDEADQLEHQQTLYHLNNLPKFAIVLIANDEADILSGADDRVRSRFVGAERIKFSRYSMAELVGILEDRVRWGFQPDVVTESTLEHIADKAAGDARAAISMLRSAARHGTEEGLEQITPDLVDDTESDAREEVHRKNVDTLTPHQRALYDCLQVNGEMEPAELYQAYRERVEDPRADRTIRDYLLKLARYDLIRVEGTSRDRRYGPVE
ncbi:Cdc6/Cdc18 family protein [Halomarina oriensis]|uniref:AAA family ATPase n=1 Tax=Halomarina oriensis TaxID=671145 RepID=A0A6B0GWV9_9EURY|nr:Cdc6/Cdc18 family protein [Halomarina oriensis]MWG36248.1 AAA family ATPase [Halomarina oriensis]